MVHKLKFQFDVWVLWVQELMWDCCWTSNWDKCKHCCCCCYRYPSPFHCLLLFCVRESSRISATLGRGLSPLRVPSSKSNAKFGKNLQSDWVKTKCNCTYFEGWSRAPPSSALHQMNFWSGSAELLWEEERRGGEVSVFMVCNNSYFLMERCRACALL